MFDVKVIYTEEQFDDKYEVFIKGDHNDADYITRSTILTKAEFEELKPALKILSDLKYIHHGWENRGEVLGEKLAQYLYDIDICDMLPYDSAYDSNIHTIEDVIITFRSKDDRKKYIVTFEEVK